MLVEKLLNARNVGEPTFRRYSPSALESRPVGAIVNLRFREPTCRGYRKSALENEHRIPITHPRHILTNRAPICLHIYQLGLIDPDLRLYLTWAEIDMGRDQHGPKSMGRDRRVPL